MPRDNGCMYMAQVCVMSVVVTVWRYVGMLVNIVFFNLVVLKCIA